MTTKYWDKPKYQRISSIVADNMEILISFENGDKVNLLSSQLLPPGTHGPKWNELRFDAYELAVPTATGEIEVSWLTLRLLSDNEFATYWAEAAEKQAKHIGIRLRDIRKKRNLSSKEVAERAGITPQSLSRIENGHHDVVFTTLEKILAAMGSTLRDLAETQPEPLSLKNLLDKLERAGLKREWVLDRLLPKTLVDKLVSEKITADLLSQAAQYLSRIFSWEPSEILGAGALTINPKLIRGIKFKPQGRTQELHAQAYVVYAHYLSLLVLQGTPQVKPQSIPKTPDKIRRLTIEHYQIWNFENLLRCIWDLGIPVLPLQDAGAFHGACWSINKRYVIATKQVTPFQARWLFDLSHELGHVIKHLPKQGDSVVETGEISPFTNSKEEIEANEFASRLLLQGRAEELVEKCVEVSGNKVERLKSAVIQVAASESIPVDILANYMAYRLALQDINWWGTANNLQVNDPTPIAIARKVFREKVDLKLLNQEDRELLQRAIT